MAGESTSANHVSAIRALGSLSTWSTQAHAVPTRGAWCFGLDVYRRAPSPGPEAGRTDTWKSLLFCSHEMCWHGESEDDTQKSARNGSLEVTLPGQSRLP